MLDVDIRFGDPWIESLKILQEQYPDEYSAYLLVKNADGDVTTDDETIRLAESCMELKMKLPSIWLREQAEVLFQKYPELRECEVVDCGNDVFVVHIAYSTVLLLAEEPSITALFPYIDYESVRKPRVVGETNGNKIYDVTLCSGIGWDAKVPAGGDLVFYIDAQSFDEAADNDYFKTAFILEPDEISCLDSLKKLSGIDSYNWFRWLSSEEGMSAAYEAELSYTDKGYRFLQNYGWTILEEGRSEAIKHCCKAGLATRYIIVLASKKQLMELFPGLNSMSVDNYNYVPDHQEIDSSCCLYVYCAGVVHAALEESQ